jgi:hypothetical protein
MLGLLVFPQQRYFNSIPETPLAELQSAGWPIPAMCGTNKSAENLRELMRYLRNGISHCNLEFMSDGYNVTGLRIWNVAPRSRSKDWEAQFELPELRILARKFIALLLETNS